MSGSQVGHDRFERLYRDHAHRILGYALRRVPTPDDAADVVAEVFTVVWRRLGEVPPGDEAVLWLYGVARFAVQNQHRSTRRRTRLSTRMRQEFRAFVDDVVALDHRPDREPVLAALAALPEADREVLCLVGWEGLDRVQVATVLGCSPGTAGVRLHRARRRFARYLAARDVEVPQRRAAAGHVSIGRATAGPDEEDTR